MHSAACGLSGTLVQACVRLGCVDTCFTDLQACHAAAREAAAQAEHAHAAAEAAAAAVLNAKRSVGDASVSAEAQAQANKAGEARPAAASAPVLIELLPCVFVLHLAACFSHYSVSSAQAFEANSARLHTGSHCMLAAKLS
jgi:hypothetical protein